MSPPVGDWTAAGGDHAATAAPYDDARTTLAARPLSTSLRPAIGFFVADRRGFVVISPPGWRAVKRWLVWVPRTAPCCLPGWPGPGRPTWPQSPGRCWRAAGTGRGHPVGARRADPWLAGVHSALQLPGQTLLTERDAPRGAGPGVREASAQFDAWLAKRPHTSPRVAARHRRAGSGRHAREVMKRASSSGLRRRQCPLSAVRALEHVGSGSN